MTKIRFDEGQVARTGGPNLFFHEAMPEEAPRAVIALIHGYADHGARYAHVMGALASSGIGTIAIDLRGHGRAEGARGYCDHFDEYMDDVAELERLVATRAKGVPSFLMGHSFGGLVSATRMLRGVAPFEGVILSAPFFGLALEVPAMKLAAAKVASRIYPKLALPSGLHGRDLSHDAERAREYDHDPLVFKKASARWFIEAKAAQEVVYERASALSMPLYCVFGTKDPVASFEQGKRVFDRASSKDKTWAPAEGLFHEVLMEPSWKSLIDPISAWVLDHAGRAST